MLWGKFVFWLRVGATVFVAIVGIGAYLQRERLIELSDAFERWIWVLGLVILAVDNVGTLFVRGYHSRKAKRTKDIEQALMSVLIQIARTKKVRFEDLGASVYTPRRLSIWNGHRAEGQPLKRIHRFRPGGFPAQSGIKWHTGHGTVGEAWEQRKTRYWSGVAIAEKWTEENLAGLTEGTFLRISAATRQGFTLKEFRTIAGKYSEIIASPIWDAGKERKIIGVLTVDRVYVQDDDEYTSQLNTPATRETVQAACRTLGTQLGNRDDG